MNNFTKENLPYLQKLVMVFAIIITMFLSIGFYADSSSAATKPVTTSKSGTLGTSLKTETETLTINLLGVTSYELTEIFNNILETTPGVIEARRCQLYLNPKDPQSGKVKWQVKYSKTTPFAVESAIYNRLKEISDNCISTYLTNGLTVNLTDNECETLKAIKPGQSTSRTLCFIEMNVFANNAPARWNNNNPRSLNNWINHHNRGFE